MLAEMFSLKKSLGGGVYNSHIWMKNMDVSKNRGSYPPNHPILIGFSIVFTIHFGGPPLFLETPKCWQRLNKKNVGVDFFEAFAFFGGLQEESNKNCCLVDVYNSHVRMKTRQCIQGICDSYPSQLLPSFWELTYPLPVGIFESLIFPTSRLVEYGRTVP